MVEIPGILQELERDSSSHCSQDMVQSHWELCPSSDPQGTAVLQDAKQLVHFWGCWILWDELLQASQPQQPN